MTARRGSGDRRRAAPWEPNDLVRLVTLSLIALAVIGIAWYGASGEGRLSQQMSWLNLAVVGILVGGAGNLTWMARGRRSVGERRRALLGAWERTGSGAASPTSAPGAKADSRLVRVAGMRFAHTADCPLVTGKKVVTVRADDAAPRCGVCGEA